MKCPFCAYPIEVPAPEVGCLPDEVRLALVKCYEDYASQELAKGHWEAHGIWSQAAEIARGFIHPTRVVVSI